MTTLSVFVSAFVETPSGEILTVDSDTPHDGWTIQLRGPSDDPDYPFSILSQDEAPDEATALRRARDLARENKCSLIEN